jgi:prevent-host-death family protein
MESKIVRIASVADVKAHSSAFVKAGHKGPMIVTRNGRPAAVLLSVDEDETVIGFGERIERIQASRE